jgi:putative transposase
LPYPLEDCTNRCGYGKPDPCEYRKPVAYDPKKHHRRSIRLRRHNYSGGGPYFITICMQDKQCLLGRVVENHVILRESGQVVQHVWETLPQPFPTVVLDAFRLMPNHLHGIFVIPGAGLELSLALATGAPVVQPGLRAMGTASRTPTPSMGEVVGAFKSISTICGQSPGGSRGKATVPEKFL